MSVNYDKILREFREGKESALKQLYDLFFTPLCMYAYRFIAEDAAVLDIVQETFIKLWDRRDKFYSHYSLRAFLYISARNACLNELRAIKKQEKVLLSENIEDERNDFIIEEEVFRLVTAEVEALPHKMREVFELTLLDLSVKDIAERLKISENTVRNQRVEARKRLQLRLKDWIFVFFC